MVEKDGFGWFVLLPKGKIGLLYEIPITEESSKAVLSIVWN